MAARDRELARAEREAAVAEARKEATEMIARANKIAEDTRDRDPQPRPAPRPRRSTARAREEITAEKERAMAELRAQVADLALEAAGKLVRSDMNATTQRRLVEEFLAETSGASRPRRGELTDGTTRHRGATLRGGGLRDRPCRRYARALGAGPRPAARARWPTRSCARWSSIRPSAFADKERVVRRVVSDVSPEALNLVLLMVRRGRPGAIGPMVDHFATLVRRHRGVALAEVRTALPLEEEQRAAVMERLHELTGDEIEINEVVDETLIGGITVRIGDRLYDASVRNRLERLRARLTAV